MKTLFTLLLLVTLVQPLHAAPLPDTRTQDTEVVRVINDFVINLKKGALSKAYQIYTAPAFRRATNLDAFTTFVAQYPSLNRNRNVIFHVVTYDKNIASVKVRLNSLEHKDNTAVFALNYEDGRWRIIGIKMYPPEVEEPKTQPEKSF